MRKILSAAFFLLSGIVVLTHGQDGCINNLTQIGIAELRVDDTSLRRLYTLCPSTVFVTGNIVDGLIVGGQNPFNLMPNMTIQCGDDGSSSNSCVVTGEIGLIGSPNNIADAGQIMLQGITFQDLRETVFFVRGGGTIEVTDCIFRSSNAVPNIYLEAVTSRRWLAVNEGYARRSAEFDIFQKKDGHDGDQRLLEDTTFSLSIIFSDCLFEDNSIGLQPGVNYTMMNMPTTNQATIFNNCVFQRNDYGSRLAYRPLQTLIYNAGYLEINDSCFINNQAFNFAPVVTLGGLGEPILNNVFASDDPTTTCDFIAYFPDSLPGSPLLNPLCINADAAACGIVAPSTVDTLPPIPPSAAPCIDDLTSIVQQEILVFNTSQPRTYVLCENTEFFTAELSGNSQDGSSPVIVRPNIRVLCGNDGRRTNNCTVTGGAGLVGSPSSFNDEPDLGSVEIVGITFSVLTELVFFIGQFNGVVEVKDCAFLESSTTPNIYLESVRDSSRRKLLPITEKIEKETRSFIELLENHEPRQDPPISRQLQVGSNSLDVTFSDCLFEGNSFGQSPGLNYTMVYIASETQKTIFRGCTFRNNDYGSALVSFVTQTLIFNNGGELVLDTNCFYENLILFNGYVNSVGLDLPVVAQNYGLPPDQAHECEFIAAFRVAPGGPLLDPVCIDFDSDVCLIGVPSTPSPTNRLTPNPVEQPSPFPTALPPTPQPTRAPLTPAPTPSPTMSSTVTDPPESCAQLGQPCSSDSDCCTNNCRGKAGELGTCRYGTTRNKSQFKLSGNRGGAGGNAKR